MSGLTGTDETRLLNPIEADHVIKGLFGSVGSLVQWASNTIGEAAKERPAPSVKETPVVGRLMLPEVERGYEDLFYKMRDVVEQKYKTYQVLVEREKFDEADKYWDDNEAILQYHTYIQSTKAFLDQANKTIRYYETVSDPTLTPEERRKEIDDAKRIKQETLEDIAKMRKQMEQDEDEAKK